MKEKGFFLVLVLAWHCCLFSDASGDQRNCGELIGIVTADEIKTLGKIHLLPYYDSLYAGIEDRFNASYGVIYDVPAVYDIAVYKVCSSCEEIDTIYYEEQELLPGYHTTTYCNQTDSAIYDIVHSSLTFVPIVEGSTDASNIQFPPNVHLRAFLSLRPTHDTNDRTPTVYFPKNISQYMNDMYHPYETSLASTIMASSTIVASKSGDTSASYSSSDATNQELRQFIVEYLPAMLAASSGSIGIIPDYLGFGESYRKTNRTILNKQSYEVAGVVSFLGTKFWLRSNDAAGCGSTSSGRTLLDMTAITIQAMEDGSFGATFLSIALQRFGLRSTSVFLAAGPLDLELFWTDTITAFASDSTATNMNGTSPNTTATAATTAATVIDPDNAKLMEMFLLSLFTYSETSIVSDSYRDVIADYFSTSSVPSSGTEGATDDYYDETMDSNNATTDSTMIQSSLNDVFDVTNFFNNTLLEMLSVSNEVGNVVDCQFLIDNPNVTLSSDETDAAGTSTAITEYLRSACYIIRINSAWNAMMHTNMDDALGDATASLVGSKDNIEWIYPITVCYSETDEIFSPEHYSSINITDSRNLFTRYMGPETALELNVAAGTAHDETTELCIIAPMLFLSYGGYVPENEIDRPNYQMPLSQEEIDSAATIACQVPQSPDTATDNGDDVDDGFPASGNATDDNVDDSVPPSDGDDPNDPNNDVNNNGSTDESDTSSDESDSNNTSSGADATADSDASASSGAENANGTEEATTNNDNSKKTNSSSLLLVGCWYEPFLLLASCFLWMTSM